MNEVLNVTSLTKSQTCVLAAQDSADGVTARLFCTFLLQREGGTIEWLNIYSIKGIVFHPH